MMKESYKILGLNEDATDVEVDEAYKKLKERYSRERFYEGEIGNDAARNLTKLENAYAEIILSRNTHKGTEKVEMDYSGIEKLIKEGRISEAQNKLDEYSERDAEWHYLQAVVFYKKNWNNESKKQLEIAMNMDPFNSKYSDSYQKLKEKTEFNQQHFNQQQAQQTSNNRQMGGTNDCMTMCATWCCIDMMFDICCGCH